MLAGDSIHTLLNAISFSLSHLVSYSGKEKMRNKGFNLRILKI
jgi:hypothetical protein